MKFDELPDWTFEVRETSANVYTVTGTDSAGRSVERQGLDPDALLEEVKADAIQMTEAEGESTR